jgi:hypothetical protein
MKRKHILAVASLAVFATSVSSPAKAQVNRTLQFYNFCSHPVRYFIYHPHADGRWYTHGWYSIRARAPAVDVNGEDRMPHIHLENSRLFVYAEATDGSNMVWRGTTPANFRGARYGMMQLVLSVAGGKYQAGLNC